MSLLISFGSNGVDLRSLPLSERRQALQAILPKGSAIVSEALSAEGRGCELFDLMCAHDLDGIVAKRLGEPYDPGVRWLKIKHPDYSQKEGRRDLFERTWAAAVKAWREPLGCPCCAMRSEPGPR